MPQTEEQRKLQADLLRIATLYRQRFYSSRTRKHEEDITIKGFMNRRAKSANVFDILENYIKKYDAEDMSTIAIRRGEVGETAHGLFSYLTSKLNKDSITTSDIYFQRGLGDPPSDTLVNRQQAALTLIAHKVDNGDVITGQEAESKKVTMSHYNQNPLARLVTDGCRREVISNVEHAILSEDIKGKIALDSMAVFRVLQAHHAKLATQQDVPTNPMRLMNYDKTAKGNVAILWYKQPKNEDDKGRMVHLYRALQANNVTALILMGDKFDAKLPEIRLRNGGKVIQNKDVGQSVDKLLTIKGDWTPKVVRYQVPDMHPDIQNNLFYQWYAAYHLALMCDAKYMVCPSRTGGSHGPMFFGVPLIYLDEYQSNLSFLGERMATFAVLDNFLTPIPNNELILEDLSPEEQLLWQPGLPFVEAALIRFMQLTTDHLTMV